MDQLETRNAPPPMPWMNLHHMDARDVAAIYQYIKSMGPIDEPMPPAVPPEKELTTSYLSLFPQNLPPIE